MSDKSHVSMEQHQCPVCGNLHDTGAILLDKRLRASMEQYTVTGQSLCPSCTQKKDDGYVALIEADEKTRQRLGRIAHLKVDVWDQVFNVPPPEGRICMVPPEVINLLEGMTK